MIFQISLWFELFTFNFPTQVIKYYIVVILIFWIGHFKHYVFLYGCDYFQEIDFFFVDKFLFFKLNVSFIIIFLMDGEWWLWKKMLNLVDINKIINK